MRIEQRRRLGDPAGQANATLANAGIDQIDVQAGHVVITVPAADGSSNIVIEINLLEFKTIIEGGLAKVRIAAL